MVFLYNFFDLSLKCISRDYKIFYWGENDERTIQKFHRYLFKRYICVRSNTYIKNCVRILMSRFIILSLLVGTEGYRTSNGWKAWTDGQSSGASPCCHAFTIPLCGICLQTYACHILSMACLLFSYLRCPSKDSTNDYSVTCWTGILWKFYWLRTGRWGRTRHIRFVIHYVLYLLILFFFLSNYGSCCTKATLNMVDQSFLNDFRVSLGEKASDEWDYDWFRGYKICSFKNDVGSLRRQWMVQSQL